MYKRQVIATKPAKAPFNIIIISVFPPSKRVIAAPATVPAAPAAQLPPLWACHPWGGVRKQRGPPFHPVRQEPQPTATGHPGSHCAPPRTRFLHRLFLIFQNLKRSPQSNSRSLDSIPRSIFSQKVKKRSTFSQAVDFDVRFIG